MFFMLSFFQNSSSSIGESMVQILPKKHKPLFLFCSLSFKNRYTHLISFHLSDALKMKRKR